MSWVCLFFFKDQCLLHCSQDMNNAIRQMNNNSCVNDNFFIIFLLFLVFNFQQNKQYQNTPLDACTYISAFSCLYSQNFLFLKSYNYILKSYQEFFFSLYCGWASNPNQLNGQKKPIQASKTINAHYIYTIVKVCQASPTQPNPLSKNQLIFCD